MLTSSEMISLAEDKRGKAERARRWSDAMATPEDQGRLLAFAEELEDEANDLERRAWQRISDVAAWVSKADTLCPLTCT